jgi:AcrR family transcriptional regulator
VRRTQRERSETTVAALVGAARELFANDGYAATSLDAVAASAGVTKGALYHHFAGKRDLFRAVFEHEQERLVAALGEAYASRRDPWDGFEAGCRAFLESSLDPGLQRIVLLDAPGVLGWEAIREIESPALQLTEYGIEQAIGAGRLPRRPAQPLAHLLFGAICEGAMKIARSADPAAMQRAVWAELRRVLRALAAA